MKKRQKLLVSTLVICMLYSLIACTPSSSEEETTSPSVVASDETSTVAESTAEADKILQLLYITPGDNWANQDSVLSEVNTKMQADGVNVAISFKRIPWDGYTQKLNLMLSTGENFDMLHIMQDVMNLGILSNMNAIIPLDDYLSKYPDLVSKFTQEQWDQTALAGKIYAVPVYWHDFTKANGNLYYREDVFKAVDDDGIFPTDFDGYFDLCLKMQEYIQQETGKTAYMWLHNKTYALSWLHRTYDEFPFFVNNGELTLIKQDGTVQSYFESDIFKKDAAAMRKMYLAGLIDPDVLNAPSNKRNDSLHVGAALPSSTYAYTDEPLLQKNIPTSTLMHTYLAPEKPIIQTVSIQNMNAMSATSDNPEAGLKFLNWLYAKKENHDLFLYGVEGKDYTSSAPTKYTPVKGSDQKSIYEFDNWQIAYLPYMRYDEIVPQKFIDYNTIPNPTENSITSPVMGFCFDTSSVSNELTNILAEVTASFYPIKFGLVDYETAYPEAIEKLKAAGIDNYIAEYQKQLTAFNESNK